MINNYHLTRAYLLAYNCAIKQASMVTLTPPPATPTQGRSYGSKAGAIVLRGIQNVGHTGKAFSSVVCRIVSFTEQAQVSAPNTFKLWLCTQKAGTAGNMGLLCADETCNICKPT